MKGGRMEISNTDRIFAEIINGILNKYCKEQGFDEYSDYEFIVFYATKNNNEKAVGAISGTIDNEFLDGVFNVLSQVQGEDKNKGTTKGLVDQ